MGSSRIWLARPNPDMRVDQNLDGWALVELGLNRYLAQTRDLQLDPAKCLGAFPRVSCACWISLRASSDACYAVVPMLLLCINKKMIIYLCPIFCFLLITKECTSIDSLSIFFLSIYRLFINLNWKRQIRII